MCNILNFTQNSLVLIPYLLTYSQECFVTTLLRDTVFMHNLSVSVVLIVLPGFIWFRCLIKPLKQKTQKVQIWYTGCHSKCNSGYHLKVNRRSTGSITPGPGTKPATTKGWSSNIFKLNGVRTCRVETSHVKVMTSHVKVMTSTHSIPSKCTTVCNGTSQTSDLVSM